MRTLSIRQRSAENTEKKECGRKKGKYLSWLKRGSERRSFFYSRLAFPVRNLGKSKSFHVQVIPDQAGMHTVLMFSPTVLALKCPDPCTCSRYGEVSKELSKWLHTAQDAAHDLKLSSPLRRILCRPGDM